MYKIYKLKKLKRKYKKYLYYCLYVTTFYHTRFCLNINIFIKNKIKYYFISSLVIFLMHNYYNFYILSILSNFYK